MKHLLVSALYFYIFLLNSITLAQIKNNSSLNIAPIGPISATKDIQECLSTKHRQDIERQLKINKEKLILQKKLPDSLIFGLQKKASSLKLSWPVSKKQGDTLFLNNWTVSNFLDLNKTSGSIQDYNCGNRTYDGHNGIDIALWPFDWYQTENNLSTAVAAASGVIIGKDDGNYSKNCSFNGSNWNAVYVQHPDGSTAWYGHLKKGTLTNKAIGEPINSGDYIGIIASSGISTGPHLHFELHNNANTPIEPFLGTCNTTNSDSLWVKQKSYFEPEINLLATHASMPVFLGCGDADYPNFQNEFHSTSKIYFTCFFKELLNNDSIHFRIENANGQIKVESRFRNTSGSYSAAWYYWNLNASDIGPEGNYVFKIILKNTIVKSHLFSIKNNGFPKISLLGDCVPGNAWNNDIPMYTSNGINYSLKHIYLKKGDCKFRANATWSINWGINQFPSGTGIQDGANIQIPAFGFYDVDFNSNTGMFQFTLVETIQIGIIGSSVNGAWVNDVKLATKDGENYSIDAINLSVGEAKFRMNSSWDANWGANTFPSGTGVNNGPNIPIQNAGKYQVSLNRKSGVYLFTSIKDTLPYLSNFSPSSGKKSSLITIKGKNLKNINGVKFGGVNAKSYNLINDSTIEAIVDSGATGTISVLVGSSELSLAGFVFLNPSKIVIDDFSPKFAAKGDTITIFAKHIGLLKAVNLGGYPVQFYWLENNTTIKAIVGNGGTGSVMIANETDTAYGNSFNFDTKIPFYISSYMPSSGTEGDTIQIVLNNTAGIKQVLFGNLPASKFWLIDQNKIAAILGIGSSGTISVINQNDTANANGFVFIKTPLIVYSFEPKSGKNGDTILITTNKTNGIKHVYFGGIPAASFWTIDPFKLMAKIGQGASGKLTVMNESDTTHLEGFNFIHSTGIENNQKIAFELYPNPTSSNLFVKSFNNNVSDITISITDIEGRTTKQFSYSNRAQIIEIPVADLGQGIYFIHILANNSHYFKRFIKND